MKIALITLLALGGAATNAHAQECLNTARELQKMMNPGDQLKAMQESMTNGAPPEIKPVVKQVIGEVMAPIMPKLEDEASKLMAKHFSCDELAKIKAFYDTPEGQSMISKMPAFMADVSNFSQQEVMRAMPNIQRRVKELMDEKNGTAPAVRR